MTGKKLQPGLECCMSSNYVSKFVLILYYIFINDIPFELHVFMLSDTESRIKRMFSEYVSLTLKTRLNMPQESQIFPRITVKTLNIGTPRLTTIVVLNIKQFNFTMQ